jgi:hypothetical protein
VTDRLALVLEDVYYGRRPGLFLILDNMESLYECGVLGEKLHEDAVRSNMHQRVRSDIIKTLGILETTGKEIRKVADKLGLPLDKAPTYQSSLVSDQADVEETYAQIILEEID